MPARHRWAGSVPRTGVRLQCHACLIQMLTVSSPSVCTSERCYAIVDPAVYSISMIELGNEGSAGQGSWLDAVEAMEARAALLKSPPLSYIFSDQRGLTGGNASRAAKMGLGGRLLTDIHVYCECCLFRLAFPGKVILWHSIWRSFRLAFEMSDKIAFNHRRVERPRHRCRHL